MDTMRCLLSISLFYGVLNGDALFEMPVKVLGNAEYWIKATYCEINRTPEFRMKGRCYSFCESEDICDDPISPGATLKMITGTNPIVHLVNDFSNTVDDEPLCHNEYCDMDITNFHT
eukprot:359674_1